MKTSIIILNYNAGDLLEKCISSIMNTKNQDFEIILVDNASKDGSHLRCKKKFPLIKMIENKENLGYSEGNNIGIRKSSGDFLVILNPDTEVLPEWLSELYLAYEKFGEGLYQPKILDGNNKNKINNTGNKLSLFCFPYQRGKGWDDKGQFAKIVRIGYPSGACVFFSRKTINKIGYFDPYLFAYYDESSLAWRAAYQKIKSYYVPNSIIYHLEGYSFKKNRKKFFLLQRNRWYCLLTLYSRKTLHRMLPGLLLLELVIFLHSLFQGFIKEKLQSYKELNRDAKFIDKKYKEIQATKLISDKELISNFINVIDFPITGTKSQRLFYTLENFLARLTYKIL